ncbi:cysteine hydrolase family protein [Streptomyces sp. NPDC093221]|uniref:cysteine hydrolase family protein n=1 Tax=Streptomyces sp. NPDC093221 TaxID=3366032 RepID=UPI0037F50B42
MSASRTALLVMDFQNGIVQRIADDSVVAAAARAVEAARAAEIPVIFVRVAFRPGYPETAASNLSFSALSQAGDAFTQDNPATQVVDALAPRADEPVAVKRRVSAFTGSDLEVLLRGTGADSLVLTGLSTSGVILSTIRQAADLDYRLTVLSDACADNEPDVHRILIEKVFPKQAQVMTTDEWVTSL